MCIIAVVLLGFVTMFFWVMCIARTAREKGREAIAYGVLTILFGVLFAFTLVVR